MSTYKIVALIGEAGSGKDSILNDVYHSLEGVNRVVTCTTRPPRTGEKDGVNYHFLTELQFLKEIFDEEFVEHTVFNNWDYGTRYRDLDPHKVNIGVFNPSSIRWILKNANNVDLKVYYIHCEDKERFTRQLMRDENADLLEMCRRYIADKKDFEKLNFEYTQYENTSIVDKERIVNDITKDIKDNFI